VEKLLEGKTPRQVNTLRILDPACGSGSFLLGAYQTLLDWHLEWYSEHDAEKHAKGRQPKIFHGPGGDWRLTTAERKRILTNNIYGVDIDPQAVEVTKLSLLLKVLEGENAETLGKSLRLFHERALPDLADNIKCGNSLIGPDFYEGKQLSLIDEEERYRINAFDWDTEFPEIMTGGGFDAVIGNPPYVRTLNFGEEKSYFKLRYDSATGGYDLYILFMEKALGVVNEDGLVGLITPNKYFVADYGKGIRKQLLGNASIAEIADFGKCRSLFKGALISTAITIYSKGKRDRNIRLRILSDDTARRVSELEPTQVPINQLVTEAGAILVYQSKTSLALLTKLRSRSRPLVNVAEVRTGVMGFDYWALDKFIADGNKGPRIATNSYIDKYAFLWGKRVKLYKRSVLEPRLDPTCDVISDSTWELFRSKKIVIRGVARRLTATLDEEGVGILVAVHAVQGRQEKNEFLLGLLNSRLFNWIHHVEQYSARIPQGSLRYPVSFLSNLPICKLDHGSSSDEVRHDRMVELVETMLKLHKDLKAAKTDHEKSLIQRQIAATDKQIDQLVYELYDLTEEEIGIVEKGESKR